MELFFPFFIYIYYERHIRTDNNEIRIYYYLYKWLILIFQATLNFGKTNFNSFIAAKEKYDQSYILAMMVC